MQSTFLFTGSWNIPLRGMSSEGDGIHVFRLNPETGALTPVFHFRTSANTSILALHPHLPVLYATDEQRNHDGVEGAGGGVLAFSIDPATGALALLANRPTYAACTSYVHVDPTGRLLAFSNHGSTAPGCYALRFRQTQDGRYEVFRETDAVSTGVYPLDGRGIPAQTPQLFPLAYNGAHLHSAMFSPDGRFLLSCDKGTDKLCVFRADAAAQRIVPNDPPFYQASARIAPRHIVFQPGTPFFFVCNELGYTVSAYRLDGASGEITPLCQLPTIPSPLPDSAGGTADIRLCHGFLYVSTRFREAAVSPCYVAIYAVHPDGRLRHVAYLPLPGDNPRGIQFSPDGRFFYTADMNSHTITRFLVDAETGLLSQPQTVAEVGSPSCIQIGQFTAPK